MKTLFAALLLPVLLLLTLSAQSTGTHLHTLNTASGGLVKTLDPAQADDIASRDLTALVYDTLVQYDYHARPYKLVPSMLIKMPEVSPDFKSYTFELRSDLKFAYDPAFKKSLPVTADDVKFSILRIADARNHSPVYWMFRGKIAGLDHFRNATANAAKRDMSMYDRELPGFIKISDRKFRIVLTEADPRFLYMLAMPNAAIVSRKAVAHYGSRIARHPVGSGPFQLHQWIPNLRLEFRRNPDFRLEYAPDGKNRLPLLDRINVFQIRQMMTAWMMFLQGNLDLNAIDKDNINMLTAQGDLIPALKARQIRVIHLPEFEIRYIGFNFNDKKLGSNLKLRQALSLSYDVSRRVRHASGQLIPAQSAIPPGVAGFSPTYRNEFAEYDLAKARRLLAEAGFPNGIDPETGKPLTLTFDQSDTGISHRQMGELAVDDWQKLGINVVSVLNSKPRFFDKLRRNNIQLFRLSWIGDYPDAENFLQLFYSGNCGSCNRCNFSDAAFDRMFEKARTMPDSPDRTALYQEMVRYLGTKCAWIYEGFPVSSMLCHSWLKNYLPHDFSFVRWKYLDVDPVLRKNNKKNFRPLSFRELSGK